MNPRHAVMPDAHPEFIEYMSQPRIASYQFDAKRERHTYTDSHSTHSCYGLHSFIDRRYLDPKWVRPGRDKTYRVGKKVGTHAFGCKDASEGVACMDYIEETIKAGGQRPRRSNRFADHILDYMRDRGYALQGAEVPVHFPGIGRMTRIDLVTLDSTGKGFILWEIKCGYPAARDRKKYKFAPAELKGVACSPRNMHYMQTLYNEVGAQASGLPNVVCSMLLNVYDTALTERKADVEKEWQRKAKIRRAEVLRDMEKKRKAEREADEEDGTIPLPPPAKKAKAKARKGPVKPKKEVYKLTREKSQRFVKKYNTYVTRIMRADVTPLPKWAIDYRPHVVQLVGGGGGGGGGR